LAITADYLLDDDLKVVWRGILPMENTLFLAYDKTKVTSDQVKLLRQFCQ